MKNSFRHSQSSFWRRKEKKFERHLFLFSALIHNIGKKYDLSTGQITVSRVEPNGLTSFQIMPYTNDNMEEFQRKIDDIDADVRFFFNFFRPKRKNVLFFQLNSHEFRAVLPAIVDVIADDSNPSSPNVIERFRCRFNRFTIGRGRFIFYTIVLLLAVSFVVFASLIVKVIKNNVSFQLNYSFLFQLIINKRKYTKLDDVKIHFDVSKRWISFSFSSFSAQIRNIREKRRWKTVGLWKTRFTQWICVKRLGHEPIEDYFHFL